MHAVPTKLTQWHGRNTGDIPGHSQQWLWSQHARNRPAVAHNSYVLRCVCPSVVPYLARCEDPDHLTEHQYPALPLELQKQQILNGLRHTEFWKRLPGDSDK